MLALVDRLYEAAFVPELWPDVLSDIAAGAQSRSGAMLIVDQKLPPLYAATSNIADILREYARSGSWYQNPRLWRMQQQNHAGFLEVSEFSTPQERHEELSEQNLKRMGVQWQVGTVLTMPQGETILFTFEREAGLDNFLPDEISWLDGLRPHLARASLMAARLQLERAQASVVAMGEWGVPAAVVAGTGKVLATNALFESLSHVFRPAAFGKLSVLDRAADRLLQAALPAPGRWDITGIASFPVKLNLLDRYAVVHVIPLHRAATDIFERGAAMVAVTGYSAEGNLPSDTVLRGLFDLSPAEANIARDLASGIAVPEIAARRGVSLATVRSHLAQIFRKTGTHHQGQLVALLKGSGGNWS